MKRFYTIFVSLVLFFVLYSTTVAEESVFANNLTNYIVGDLQGQDNWLVTKYYPDTLGTARIAKENDDTFIEIISNDTVLLNHTRTPVNAGEMRFKMRHSKAGIFYLFAQTSDAGGQLLFSIQFAPLRGILLEESNRQTTLLPNYTENQWYSFVIDFDNSKGAHGLFTVKIDDVAYGEFEYTYSESTLFDFAQVTLGSENNGETSISGFSFFDTTSALIATSTASSTVTDALRQLSISLSTSSISSNLDNGLIVTTTFDGVADVVVQPVDATTSSTSTSEADDAQTRSNSLSDIIMNIVESVIEVFIPVEVTPEEIISVPPREPLTQDNQPSENKVQSSISEDETISEITTAEF